MSKLRSHSLSLWRLGNPWAKDTDFLPLTNSAYRSTGGVKIELDANIEDVHKVLAKALKPERKLITAVLFSNGKIEESSEKLPEPEPEKAQPTVATTVARPVNGCPMPNFPEADVRASRVLETFLNPDQIEDYRKTGSFITVGADSGNRYLVCNRERPNFMKSHLAGRQLFNLETKSPICVHDWAVPPPEEMLALHLCLSLPGRENELLGLPEIPLELAMQDVDPRYRP